mmetsp:Transcript_53048/g.108134  ORF Transcript_53048/g.108134 Transcript_53048/m.108134 type:complete len:173 (-) Transcript_53048:220-738(-)|eukprot:CAMPEP_0181322898 /NCGR_PEP_ID=MMETSP1101-20121128/19480_1 /TAXON_ID=46948 /ORGANISM="Rhodomonas abbreviata, Strain Caron Lab Isolate" /LENGTH=172 /DNA_ID=CAMNT_0023430855 /DNA_START=132 /DNA_END=650 /DNA_ORIENTATION=+
MSSHVPNRAASAAGPSEKDINAFQARLDALRKESNVSAQARVVLARAESVKGDLKTTMSDCHKTLAATSVHLVDYFRRIPSGELSKTIEERFRSFDTNHNGSLERGELKDALGEMGKRPTDEEVDALLAVFDTDNNGTIELEEFDQMVRINLKMMDIESVKEAREIARTSTI